MEIKVRSAQEKDIPQLVFFNCEIARQTENKALDVPIITEGVKNAIRRSDLTQYFVAEINQVLVGQMMITYEWSDWRNGVIWWIQSVYVDEKFRKQGVFKKLYQHVTELAQKSDEVKAIRLYVEKNNQSAIKVYEAMGMVPSGHILYENDWTLSHS